MVVIKIPKDDEIEAELQELKDQFKEIKEEMSALRKMGKEIPEAENLALTFQPRMKIASVTYDRRDITKLKELLIEIRVELNAAKRGSDFDHILSAIREAYEFIRQKKFSEAKEKYKYIMEKYKEIDSDSRSLVYEACVDIHHKLKGK
ncbi:hypothetical protein D6745_01105 [Candidatus Woesearchaeota archaeon]|nr:MAG: hypothetical protein D6745_01105 [Candidatus Woesearchaeota archaeon]